MGVLSALEPAKVFQYFEEICSIPHGSRNVEQISNYLVNFAKERGLKCRQDEKFNVVIWKDGSKGYENAEPVILQGHMDMVAVKTADCPKDMEKDGLDLEINGDLISAKGTSLGGDDGIAVAYSLAILDDPDMAHPPIEAIFTTGTKAAALYRKLCLPKTGMEAIALPSTSAANCRFYSYEQLVKAYAAVKEYLN